eukprot:Hpha_TRINITY_DN8952_c0_g2::TRINITY_DN8952_c0_g2_i1::g.80705::m.80705
MIIVIHEALKIAPYVLFSENDRPVHHFEFAESALEAKARVQAYLTLTLGIIVNSDTPHVNLERNTRGDHLKDKNETSAGSECWSMCYAWLKADRRRSMSKTCTKIQRPVFKGKVEWPADWNSCMWKICREWGAFTDVTLAVPEKIFRREPQKRKGEVTRRLDGLGPSQCLTTWVDKAMSASAPAFRARLVSVVKKDEGRLVCARTRGWSNGPALFNGSWWMEGIAGPMCKDDHKATQSGLVFQRVRPHFGRYGRAMERYIDGYYDKGITKCLGDGIMDHVELEAYDNVLASS